MWIVFAGEAGTFTVHLFKLAKDSNYSDVRLVDPSEGKVDVMELR